jgi:hypothetical protein
MREAIQQAVSWQPDSALGLPGSSNTHSGRSWARVVGDIAADDGSGDGLGAAVGVAGSVGTEV